MVQFGSFLLILVHFHWFFLLPSHIPYLLTLLTTVFISVIVLYGFKISIAYFFVILIFLLRFPTHGAIFIIFVFNSLNRVCIIRVFSVVLKFLSAKFCLWTPSYSVFANYFLFSPWIWVTLPCFCKPHNFFFYWKLDILGNELLQLWISSLSVIIVASAFCCIYHLSRLSLQYQSSLWCVAGELFAHFAFNAYFYL